MNEMLQRIIDIRNDKGQSINEITENKITITKNEKSYSYAYKQGMLVINHERLLKAKPDMETLNRINNTAIMGKHVVKRESGRYCFQWESRIGDDLSDASLKQIVFYSENQFLLGYKALSARALRTREKAIGLLECSGL